MRDLDLQQLADWFAEAKDIYCRRRTDLAESEYQQLEPFTLNGTEGDRFDELGTLFIGERSELFDIGWRIRAYAATNTVRKSHDKNRNAEQNGCRQRLEGLSVVSATSCARRRLIRDVRPTNKVLSLCATDTSPSSS
jgi:hypothetical protein